MNKFLIPVVIVAVSTVGCIQLKTESEIKPIHITMDVNLKVDKELDKTFASEDQHQAKGDYAAIKTLIDRKAAGFTNTAMLEARDGATDDDKMTIAEANLKRMKRFREVAQKSGSTLEAVQKRRVLKLREMAAPGTWLQGDDGKWSQK